MTNLRQTIETRIKANDRIILFAEERDGDQPLEDWASTLCEGFILVEDEDGDLVKEAVPVEES